MNKNTAKIIKVYIPNAITVQSQSECYIGLNQCYAGCDLSRNLTRTALLNKPCCALKHKNNKKF